MKRRLGRNYAVSAKPQRMSTRRQGAGIFIAAVFCCLVQALPALAQNPGIFWEKKKVITRPVVKNKPKRPPLKAPLLTMRWQMWVSTQQAQADPVDPRNRTFVDGELVRLAIQVNQKGYLYVINHTVKSDKTIEGPKLISHGKYAVEKNHQDVHPKVDFADCPKGAQKGGKCWWLMMQPAGREVVTIIFSRDEIEEWVNLKSEWEPLVDETLIHELTRQSPGTRRAAWTVPMQGALKLTGIAGPHVMMVWNPNRQNNEILVERIEFNHK